VRALARRSYGFDGDTIELRGLLLQVPTRRVSVHGRPVELTASEYALLKTLLMRANRVITRRVLEEHILLAAWPMPAIPWTCTWVICAAR
jgi:two-component system response regulator QseB